MLLLLVTWKNLQFFLFLADIASCSAHTQVSQSSQIMLQPLKKTEKKLFARNANP